MKDLRIYSPFSQSVPYALFDVVYDSSGAQHRISIALTSTQLMRHNEQTSDRVVIAHAKNSMQSEIRTRSLTLAIAKSPCHCCIILKSGSYTKAI